MLIELGDLMLTTKSEDPAVEEDLQGKAFP
jgi:hypothetical protein